MKDKRLVLINDDDNVFICCGKVQMGECLSMEKNTVKPSGNIHVGHKVARQAIRRGDKIIKYGVTIGSAVEDIGIGELVHLHNMKSEYIASHTREHVVELG